MNCQLLQERWQPAPVLLLLPGQTPYPSEALLRLSAEGLLQQAEPSEIPQAVATLLSGGRIVELRPLAANGPEPEALGFGQWLLRSGLSQIQAEQRRCERWLEQCGGGVSRLLLLGRLRELAAARRLLLWLWGREDTEGGTVVLTGSAAEIDEVRRHLREATQ